MRTTKTVSISMPPGELKLAERLAKSTNRSLSGVVREGIKRLASEQYWQEVQAVARPKAEALGINEDDVNRLVEEYRREKPGKATIKKKAK
jgi:Arc/MetJ-type ribon-helix-helix transcriptional regulator